MNAVSVTFGDITYRAEINDVQFATPQTTAVVPCKGHEPCKWTHREIVGPQRLTLTAVVVGEVRWSEDDPTVTHDPDEETT